MPLLVAPAIPAGTLAAARQPTLPLGDDAVLRPWLLTDAEAVTAAYQDPAIQRWYVRRADSVAEARGWIEAWQQGWRTETRCDWAVAATEGDLLLGRISLKALNLTDGNAELAYWVVPAARGRGVCPRAVEAVTSWAFEHGFHRLDLDHSTANQASCRVATKAGYAVEGTRRAAALHADGRHDMHVHSRIRQD